MKERERVSISVREIREIMRMTEKERKREREKGTNKKKEIGKNRSRVGVLKIGISLERLCSLLY